MYFSKHFLKKNGIRKSIFEKNVINLYALRPATNNFLHKIFYPEKNGIHKSIFFFSSRGKGLKKSRCGKTLYEKIKILKNYYFLLHFLLILSKICSKNKLKYFITKLGYKI